MKGRIPGRLVEITEELVDMTHMKRRRCVNELKLFSPFQAKYIHELWGPKLKNSTKLGNYSYYE